MKVAKIAVSVFNKHQNRTFSELCNKYGIKHISTSKITLPTYMMLIITSDNITAVTKFFPYRCVWSRDILWM